MLERIAARLPAQCAVCHRWPARAVCESCVGRFAQPVTRCRRCALPVPARVDICGACLASPPPLDACHAAVAYDYPWSALIARFKFAGEPAWSRTLGLLMRSAPWVEPAIDACDIAVPMPLAAGRLAERGFNQSLLLARALAPGKVEAGLLVRVRDTPPQVKLPRPQRIANVHGAFAVEPLRVDAVRGKKVVLVDDVMTSGASLFAAAGALRHAGATHVTGIVFARTDEGP